MFTIVPMESGGEDYLPSQDYYFGKRRRKRKRVVTGGPTEDDSPDIDGDPEGQAFGDVPPYSESVPGEPPGLWMGAGAASLGLSGEIHEEEYRRIYRGFHPFTGEPLVRKAGDPNRRPGFEGCLSAFKDFSILTFAVPNEWRDEFLAAFREVAEAVIKMIEERFAFSRVTGTDGKTKYVRGKLVVGAWQHSSSRRLDEDVHIHLQLFGLLLMKDGRWGSLEPLSIFRNQKLITAWGQSKLISLLAERFGLVVERDGATLRIRGFPPDLVKQKSKRRQQILDWLEEHKTWLAEHELSGGKAAALACKETRPRKDALISWAELIERWRAENAAAGLVDAYVMNLLRNAPRRPSPVAQDASEAPSETSQAAKAPTRAAVSDTSTSDPAHERQEDDLEALQNPLSSKWQTLLADRRHQPQLDESDQTTPPTTADSTPLQSASLPQPFAKYSSLAGNNPQPDGPHIDSDHLGDQTQPDGSQYGPPVPFIPVAKRPGRLRAPSRRLIRKVIQQATHQRNHFSEYELVLYTLYRFAERALDPAPVFDEVASYIQTNPNIVPLGVVDGWHHYTTKQILKDERRLLAAVERLSKRPGRRVPEKRLKRILRRYAGLTQEQVAFIRHLAQSNSALRIGLGYAGTGKSTAQRAVADASGCRRPSRERPGRKRTILGTVLKILLNLFTWRKGRIFGVAPTGIAAELLAKATGIECQTLTKFLGDYRLPLSARILHDARQFWRAFRGRPTWPFRQPRPTRLTKYDVVLVDEAGLAGTPLMRKLVELVERAGATLLLVGDPRQYPAVMGTPPLQSLARRYGAPVLKNIRRQKKNWAREAARCLAEGQVGRALALFNERNLITVRDNLDHLVRQACLDWVEEGLFTPHRALILAIRNDVAHAANTLAQKHRLEAGCIRPSPSTRITDEQDDAVYESRVYRGDRVVFTHNSNEYGVKNGSLGTVFNINIFTGEIAVMLDNKKKKKYVKVNVNKFPHVRLAYALTSFRSQSTEGAKIFAIAVGGTNSLTLPAGYVMGTRAIEQTRWYTTSFLFNPSLESITQSRLAKRMSRRPDLRLATELLENAPLELRPQELRIRKTPGQRPKEEPAMIVESTAPPNNSQPHKAAEQERPKEKPIMNVQGMPSNFWLVTRPSPRSNLAQICSPCNFTEFLLRCRIKGGVRREDIFGIYAQKDEAVAAATILLDAMPQTAPVQPATQDHPAIKYSGMPSIFWLVTTPTSNSELADICSEWDFDELALHVLFSGLSPKQVVGVYADANTAIATASRLLHAVRPHPNAAAQNHLLQLNTPFWMVTRPTSCSEFNDICSRCDFRKLALQILGGLRPEEIVGVYADKHAAIASACKLLEAGCQSLPTDAPPSPSPAPVDVVGLPSSFWTVTMPTLDSNVLGVCSKNTFRRFASQVLGGLQPEAIVGVYAERRAAVATATKLLNVIREIHGVATAASTPSDLLQTVEQSAADLPADQQPPDDKRDIKWRLLHKTPRRPSEDHCMFPFLPPATDGTLVSTPRGSYRRISGKVVFMEPFHSRDRIPPDTSGMQVVGLPSRFWIVKRPTPTSRVEDIYAECSFTQFAPMLKADFPFKDVAGFYAWEYEARNRAQALVQALHSPRAKIRQLLRHFFSFPVEIAGLPLQFWLVMKPTPTSDVDDVRIKCSFKRLARMIKKGFPIDNAVGIYADKRAAFIAARRRIRFLRQWYATNISPPLFDPNTSTRIVGIPSRFWMVKTPTPTSGVKDICVECSIPQLAHMFKRGLRIKEIAGFYAEKNHAIDDANSLLKAIEQPDAAGLPPARFDAYPIKSVGMPSRFWLVKRPTPSSHPDEICVRGSLPRVARMIKQGFSITDLAAICVDEDFARQHARVLVETMSFPAATNADSPAEVVGMPSRFWVVKKPTPHARADDLYFQCSFMQLSRLFKESLSIEDISGFYTEWDDAIDDANALVEAMSRPETVNNPSPQGNAKAPIVLIGLPWRFWLVKTPTPSSRAEDICIKCSPKRLATMLKSGLPFEEIVGFYARQDDAMKRAQEIVGSLPPPDPSRPPRTPQLTLLPGSRSSIAAPKPPIPKPGPLANASPQQPPPQPSSPQPVAYSPPATDPPVPLSEPAQPIAAAASTSSAADALSQPADEPPTTSPQPLVTTFSDAAGYQRLRLPTITRRVTNGTLLFASCVDGGSPEHCHRPPPPPGHPMPYAADSVHVQRITPVPSARMPLAAATKLGMFSLHGTGSQDRAQVACPPGQLWVLTVGDPLGLISPQDDIAGALALYGEPAITRQLENLDNIEEELRRFLPEHCFLLSLFSCVRREISWRLPAAEDPAAVAREYMQRLCRMLFSDPVAFDLFTWFHGILKENEEPALVNAFANLLPLIPYPPSQDVIQGLCSALADHRPVQSWLTACSSSIRWQYRDVSEAERDESLAILTKIVDNLQSKIAARLSPQQQQGILGTLCHGAGQPLWSDPHFLEILAYPIQIDHQRFDSFPALHCVWHYATNYVRGNEAAMNEKYRRFLAE